MSGYTQLNTTFKPDVKTVLLRRQWNVLASKLQAPPPSRHVTGTHVFPTLSDTSPCLGSPDPLTMALWANVSTSGAAGSEPTRSRAAVISLFHPSVELILSKG